MLPLKMSMDIAMASYSNLDDCTVTGRIEIQKDWVIEAAGCCVFFYAWGPHYGLLIIVIVL